jgi:hypothetical protein
VANPETVIAFGGQQLARPHRSGDCTCLFCGLFRSHHYWMRAVLATAVVPVALWLAHDVDTFVKRNGHGGGPLIAIALLVATGITLIALFCWYQPLRRLIHLCKPRSTAWPPA